MAGCDTCFQFATSGHCTGGGRGGEEEIETDGKVTGDGQGWKMDGIVDRGRKAGERCEREKGGEGEEEEKELVDCSQRRKGRRGGEVKEGSCRWTVWTSKQHIQQRSRG